MFFFFMSSNLRSLYPPEFSQSIQTFQDFLENKTAFKIQCYCVIWGSFSQVQYQGDRKTIKIT